MNKINISDEKFEEISTAVDELRDLSERLDLNPNDVNFWIVTNDDINQLAAYDGFQTRYPHWRWGMKYEEQRKKDAYFGGKIFELVHHDDEPAANAFLQKSNTMQEQKSVIAHVFAHADFFANNQFFPDNIDATQMLEQNANIIESYYDDPSIDQNEVERWIDAVLCIEEAIDPLKSLEEAYSYERESQIEQENTLSTKDKIESLDVSEEIKEQVFEDMETSEDENEETHRDILAYLLENGKAYDEDSERAVDYEDWQRSIIEIIRRESYYFSAQKKTKIMNEGWASYWESIMMMSENYIDFDSVIQYADKQSKVLGAPGLNPYKLGLTIWKYIENKYNRKEVIKQLLRVEGITRNNIKREVDFSRVEEKLLEYRDEDVPCEKHYSLTRIQNKGFIESISDEEIKQISRYMFDTDRYETIDEAIQNVDYEKGWDKMRQVRETHNDITFIDTFLNEEFIKNEKYFTYDYNPDDEQYQISGTGLNDVKKKLLLNITNGGRPVIVAADDNYNNSGELLLLHKYNGINMDIEQAKDVLKRVHDLWGRPVHLHTIRRDFDGNEEGIKLFCSENKEVIEEDLDEQEMERLKEDNIDYRIDIQEKL